MVSLYFITSLLINNIPPDRTINIGLKIHLLITNLFEILIEKVEKLLGLATEEAFFIFDEVL